MADYNWKGKTFRGVGTTNREINSLGPVPCKLSNYPA